MDVHHWQCLRSTDPHVGINCAFEVIVRYAFYLWTDCEGHLDVNRSKVKTVYGQNGNTETATEMAIFKTATNQNNTYSYSEAYIIGRRL